MLEFLKLIANCFVLRDLKQQGQFSGNSMLLGFGLVLFLFATAFPAGLLAIHHPRYNWVFFTTLVVDAIVMIYVLILGTRWQRRAKDSADAHSSKPTTTSE